MIELSAVGYKYPRAKAEVIHDFSARFERGEIAAISGKNGCGKTTLTKLITGILRPDCGKISIDGEDSSGMSLFDIGKRVGYVFQNPSDQLFCASVYDETAYGLLNIGLSREETDEKVRFYLNFFRLTGLENSLPDTLSLGEKQRVALACVLSMGTDYLIMDEPTTGLDMRSRAQLGELLTDIKQTRGAGIILVSHDSGFIAKIADRELVMGT